MTSLFNQGAEDWRSGERGKLIKRKGRGMKRKFQTEVAINIHGNKSLKSID
jgi:hypothetical protein